MTLKKTKIPNDIKTQLLAARKASFVLANMDVSIKDKILYKMSEKIREKSSLILEENAKDISEAKRLYELGELSLSLCERVTLNESKIEQMAKYCESVAELPNPNNCQSIRFSFSRYTTKNEIDFTLEKIKELVALSV